MLRNLNTNHVVKHSLIIVNDNYCTIFHQNDKYNKKKSKSEKIRMNEYQSLECPDVVIEEGGSYTAVLETDAGDIHIELFPDTAPKAVNSFMYRRKYKRGIK